MTIIVFVESVGGHHLEYIHHIYEMAVKEQMHQFIFLLPREFRDVCDKMTWANSSNAVFNLYDDAFYKDSDNGIIKVLERSYKICKFINKKKKEYAAEIVYSNVLMSFLPWAPILIKGNVKLTGIIYRIYLYDKNQRSLFSLFLDKIKYMIIANSHFFYKVFVLNDGDSARQLNEIYRTDKFLSIPDPFIPLGTDNLSNIRELYHIDNNKKLLVQMGTMNTNKGTIEILESIRLLPEEDCKKITFFFAGIVTSEIRTRFYELYEDVKNRVQILIRDEFCDYNFYASLCVACDALLTPYRRIAQSSGIIGYAAQFRKPVIAPKGGLLGKLVMRYKLGILIEDNSPQQLIMAYHKIENGNISICSEEYCKVNSIESFQNVIRSNVLNSIEP